ncbi:hypothetical protein H7F50_19070 [Novosphingobium flavum]|uniref:AtuA-like ferredoxin-fold domain-containing protein n=1 Tax=Novosphingobium aerophilum TaxID=2839843 RepID=A0A7X1F504_9SPHN|nr:hypothetical protein [Novosphingobium aerophilum]MBC2650501.1 hypothetical protein [Novosphingobium aerophilum]MBC2663819.1 hypothetical protein [Novosphingobium aerophilum]
MILRDIAHVRTGDKGNTAQIAVFARSPEAYPLLVRAITAGRIAAHLPALPIDSITCYELPGLCALNFVIEGALAGGVTRSLALDPHGKTLGAQLLDLPIEEPAQ